MKLPEITNRGNFNKLRGPPCRFHRTSSLPIPKGYESSQRLRKSAARRGIRNDLCGYSLMLFIYLKRAALHMERQSIRWFD